MNYDQVAGMSIYLVGALQMYAGKFVGNKNMELRGFRNTIAGSAQKSVGDAQELIKRCLKRRRQLV